MTAPPATTATATAPPAPATPTTPWYDRFAGSGAAVGDLFRRALALIFLVAWVSLATQVRLLIGARGLLPLGDFLDAARDQAGLSFRDFPTLLWWAHSDGALHAGVVAGMALAVAALLGVWPRLCFALSTALYLSYATAGRLFLSFQWDNLLLECGFLAAFLPAGRRAPLTHLLFRLVLFKLYFESGLAKWQSPLHDWQDGSAMTLYYETAPLPTFLAWHAHRLPAAWHHFESRATLFLELVVPFAIFGGRRLRLGAAALFTAFQIANAATANYGFFCYLATALHAFLLDDADVLRAKQWIGGWGWVRWARTRTRTRTRTETGTGIGAPSRHRRLLSRIPAIAGLSIFLLVSLLEGLLSFTEPTPFLVRFEPLLRINQTLRLVNTYHLFAAITRERVEPELQTSGDAGAHWTAQELHHKPGAPSRAPDVVAPHQPRVDFQLWFHGLSYGRRPPAYVAALVGHLCDDPEAVQPLFRTPLPARPDAVRVAYWRYHFTTPDERSATGNWWRREWIGATGAVPCHR